MSYQDLLYPWTIYRLNSHLKHCPIARFRQRNDAEAYLLIVKQMIPQIEFAIVFDPPTPNTRHPNSAPSQRKPQNTPL